MSDVTAILNTINNLNRTNVKIINKTVLPSSNTNNYTYIELGTMSDTYSVSRFNIVYTGDDSGDAFEHHIIFEVVKSKDREYSINVNYNKFTGDNQPITYIKTKDSTRKIYLVINTAYKTVGTLNISTTIETSSSNIINPDFVTDITADASIDLSNTLIFSTPEFSLYQDESGDIVFDGGENRIKAKTTATGFADTIYVTGDGTYGVSTEKIKENIKDVSYPDITNFIRNTDIKQFNYIQKYDPDKNEDISFIIEDLPESYIKDILIKYNEEGLDKYKLNTLVMLLFGALKEEIDRNDTLVKIVHNLSIEHNKLERNFDYLDTVVGLLLGEKINGSK